MKPSGPILEANLARLLRQAWTPVQPRPEFRARLLEEVGRERPRRLPTPRRGSWVLPLGALAAAAAALLILLNRGHVAPQPAPGSVGVPLADILGTGEVAVRPRGGAAWRQAAPDERLLGVAGGDLAELATPPGATIAGRLRDGSFELEPSSRLAFGDPGEDAATLLSGALTLDRPRSGAPGEAWGLRVRELVLVPDAGRLRVERRAHTGEVLVQALEGRLSLFHGEDVMHLAPGEELLWRSGEPRYRRVEVSLNGTQGASNGDLVEGEGEAPGEAVPELLLRVANEENGLLIKDFEVQLQLVTPMPDFQLQGLRVESGVPAALPQVEPGRYHVYVFAKGFAMGSALDRDFRAGERLELEVSLRPSPRLPGRVVDLQGVPVEGASVVAEADTPKIPLPVDPETQAAWLRSAVSTGPDGRFELDQVGAGRQVLRAVHSEHGVGWSEPFELGQLERGAEGDLLPLTVVLEPTGSLEGRVYRPEGTPWPEVYVVAYLTDPEGLRPRTTVGIAEADFEGRYRIEALPVGAYSVARLGSDDHPEGFGQPVIQTLAIRPGATAELDFGRPAFPDPGGVVLRGEALDRDGEPVPNAFLSLMPVGSNGTRILTDVTDSDGGFSFEAVPPGPYEVYYTEDFGRLVVLLARYELGELPEHVVDLTLPRSSLAGSVTNEAGEPIPRVLMLLLRQTSEGRVFYGRTTTDDEGRYRLPHASPGTYRAVFFDTGGFYGQEHFLRELAFEEGVPETLDVVMHPGGGLVIEVRDEDGQPVVGADLDTIDVTGLAVEFAETMLTGDDGRFVIPAMKPGPWRVRASAKGHSAEGSVSIQAELDSELHLILPIPAKDSEGSEH